MPIIADGATAANAFDANNIDVNTTGTLPQDIPKYKKNGALQIDPALGTYYYGFNVKNISDVNQRRAMAFAIDQSAIIKYITQTGQLPAKGFTPRGIAGGPTIDKNSFVPAVHQTAKRRRRSWRRFAHPSRA